MAGTQGALLLTAAAPMDGPPARSITLIPDSSDERDGTEIDRWQFAGEFPDGKFISCAYGSEGVVLLAKRIDDRTTGCEVIYKKHQGKLAVNDIVCKMP